MKAKLTRELEVSPACDLPQSFLKDNSHARTIMRNGRMRPVMFWKVGTVFSLPDAYGLVLQGCAIPADDECAKKCDMSDEQIARAQHAYERLARGIHPEDFALYDAGIIEGYNPDGSYKPGPNAEKHPEVFVPDDDEDDDE